MELAILNVESYKDLPESYIKKNNFRTPDALLMYFF